MGLKHNPISHYVVLGRISKVSVILNCTGIVGIAYFYQVAYMSQVICVLGESSVSCNILLVVHLILDI